MTGLLNKQIAGELGTRETTIKIHRHRVMEKMERLPWPSWSGWLTGSEPTPKY